MQKSIFALILLLSVSAHGRGLDIHNTSINDFWITFSSMDLVSLGDFYENRVILLPRSMLRSRYYGIDTGAEGSKVFPRESILQAYDNLERIAPREHWVNFFSNAYKRYKLTTVENADGDIKPYIRPQDVYDSSFLKLFNYLKFFGQNIAINDDDLVLKVYRTDILVRQRLIFVFDKETMKIKAQAILVGLLDKDYFINNPYAM